MEQDDPPQPTYQSFRLAHLSTPGDIVRIETVYHSIARQQVVFWDDVLVVFPRVRWIEYGNMIPAFLRGEDYSRLQPLCFAAVLDDILDVVVRTRRIRPLAPSPPSYPSSFLDRPIPSAPSSLLDPLQSPHPLSLLDTLLSSPPLPFLDPPLSSAPSSFLDSPPSSIALPPSEEHSQNNPLNSASDKKSVIRLPVYRDPESGLTGFTMNNHAPIANPATLTTVMATSTETSETQTQQTPSPSTITTTTVYDTQLQREALNLMQTNARQGILSAMLDLGGFYYHGEGGTLQNFSRAMRWFTQAAEDHVSAEAQYNIGTMYHQGHGVIHNFETALEWYQKAAAQGYASAQYSIGLLYLNGEGVAQDFVMAMEWFLKSADQGSPSAQIAVGNMYFHGLGVSDSYHHALEWYIKAAGQECAAAQSNIGIMFFNGLGVRQDQREAIQWITRAAKGNDASAQRYLERASSLDQQQSE